MTRVPVHPEMLRWACERAGYGVHDLAPRFPQLPEWARGEKMPTFKQLEAFARATHTPFGFLFLPEPPQEPLPIPDFRTLRGRPARPSPDLLDTIYAMQRRQDWLRQERIEGEADPLGFVGSARLNDDPSAVGQEMRRTSVWTMTTTTGRRYPGPDPAGFRRSAHQTSPWLITNRLAPAPGATRFG